MPDPEAAAAVAIVAEALKDVVLDADAQNRIVDLWLQGSSDERLLISLLYPRYFRDPTFLERVHLRASMRAQRQTPTDGAAQPPSRSGAASGRNTPAEGDASGAAAGGNEQRKGPARVNQATRKLRNQIDDAVPKLMPGSGPHPVRFGIVSDVTLNTMAVELYNSQFTQPDLTTLRRIVLVPRQKTTRTRRNLTGNYTWFLWCNSTNEMVCAVTVTVHQMSTSRFIEMPLFATRSGYKRVGFGRLLNAALQEYCVTCGASFILVSADQAAVPFWTSSSMGYSKITREQERRVDFFYKMECTQFQGSSLLTWVPPDGATGSIGAVNRALEKAPMLCLDGSSKLPLP